MSHSEDANALLICPYEVSHSILRYRMAKHLTACRKAHAEIAKEKSRCPFNSNHIVSTVELSFHESICSSRGNTDTYIYQCDREVAPVINAVASINVDPDESWDNDCEGPQESVLEAIQKNNEGKPIVRLLCSSKAEKKAFRIRERERLRNLVQENNNAVNQDPGPSFSKGPLQETAIRRPKPKYTASLSSRDSVLKKREFGDKDDTQSYCTASSSAYSIDANDITAYNTALSQLGTD